MAATAPQSKDLKALILVGGKQPDLSVFERANLVEYSPRAERVGVGASERAARKQGEL